MSTDSRALWKKRRFLLPAAAIALVAVSLLIAVIRSGTSQVIIYNDTGTTLGPLVVRACGQKYTFDQIPDETSVRFRLERSGEASAVELSLATEPAWRWEGGYLEPHGGNLMFVHIRRGMEVETNTQISIWQQVLFGHNIGN